MAELTIAADDAVSLLSFHSWLRRSRDVAQHGEVSATPARGGSSMNAVETIGVVVGSVTAIANVLIAYGTWRGTRQRPAPMTVTLRHVTVAIDDPAAQEKLAAAWPGPGHAS